MKWKDLEWTAADLKAFLCADLSCSVGRNAKLNTEEAFPHLNSRCQEKLKLALLEEEALQIKTDRHKHGSQDKNEKKRCLSRVKCRMKRQKEFLNWFVGRTTFCLGGSSTVRRCIMIHGVSREPLRQRWHILNSKQPCKTQHRASAFEC